MKKKIMYKLYYHNDMDGMCSRVIMEKYIDEHFASGNIVNNGENTKVIESYELKHDEHDMKNIAEITGNEALVIFVDYSFSENTLEVFKEIVRRTNGGKRLLWIDHHDSSIDFVNRHILCCTNPEETIKMPIRNFIISKSGSGAYLAWALYQSYRFLNLAVHHQSLSHYYEVSDMYDMLQYVPPMVRYVSDYDTFEHRLPDTDYFKLGYDHEKDKYLFMCKLFNFSGEWDANEEREKYPDKWIVYNLCEQTIETGKTIMDYITAENETVIKVQGYESCIKDLKTGQMELVYVCNRFSNSWVFGDLYNKYRYVIVYYFDGAEYKYSIFSNLKIFKDTNCQKYAEQFGGGGHKGAAGWRSGELMFLKDTFVNNEERSWILPEQPSKEYREQFLNRFSDIK